MTNKRPVEKDPRPTLNDIIQMPAAMIPSWRTHVAVHNGVEKNLLFKTWGGIGDQICAEPTLRYVLRAFHDADVSLASELPQLFKHLKFKSVFDLTKVKPIWDNYFIFDTITHPTHLTWEFFSHCLVNCVDYPALSAVRCQLPVADREILLTPDEPTKLSLRQIVNIDNAVFVHAGRHWESKTFPKDWWDAVIAGLVKRGLKPVLVGADADDNRGTVDVDASHCIDLRNKTTLEDLIWILQRGKVLITNDSSPLHMAASRDPRDKFSGRIWIGYIATCKHPDFISHFRRPGFSQDGSPRPLMWNWREENLGLDGMWNHVSHCPNQEVDVKVDKVEEEKLRTFLPAPEGVAEWALSKIKTF